MKKVLVLLVSLLSLSAFACPDLAGKYMCGSVDDNGNTYELETTITQEGNKYTWMDVEGTDEIVADGVYRKMNDDMMMRANCAGAQLVFDANGSDGGMTFTVEGNIEKVNGDLITNAVIKYGDQTFEDVSTCTAM